MTTPAAPLSPNDRPAQNASAGSNAATYSESPLNPREDPFLVGDVAASQARAQRLYRESCMNGEEGISHESKSWDFMITQMADWDNRERCWAQFRKEITTNRSNAGGKILGKKIKFRAFRSRA